MCRRQRSLHFLPVSPYRQLPEAIDLHSVAMDLPILNILCKNPLKTFFKKWFVFYNLMEVNRLLRIHALRSWKGTKAAEAVLLTLWDAQIQSSWGNLVPSVIPNPTESCHHRCTSCPHHQSEWDDLNFSNTTRCSNITAFYREHALLQILYSYSTHAAN